MRWIVVVFQAVILTIAALATFVLTKRYPEYVPDGILVNQSGFVFTLGLLFATVRSVAWADVKVTAAIGCGLFVLSLLTRALWDRASVSSLLMLQAPDLEGLSLAFSYAFLTFTLFYIGVLLVKLTRR